LSSLISVHVGNIGQHVSFEFSMWIFTD